MMSWHVLKHSFSHLKWMVDLALMYQTLSQSSDFMKYLTRLPDDSIRKSAWYVLRFLSEVFEIPVAPSLIYLLRPAKIGWIERQAFTLIQAGNIREFFAELSFLGSIGGVRPKLQFVREMFLYQGFGVDQAFNAGWSAIKTAFSCISKPSVEVLQRCFRVSKV